jgi:hypothetical protein
VPRVAWPGVPPPRGGLFWQKISQGVLSGISLVQMVQCVKNSVDGGVCFGTGQSCKLSAMTILDIDEGHACAFFYRDLSVFVCSV